MTEAEWLACTDLRPIFQYLHGRMGDRKARLLRVGAARSVWAELTDERYRAAVEVGERYADGRAADDERHAHMRSLYDWFSPGGGFAGSQVDRAARDLNCVALSCVDSPRVLRLAHGPSWSFAVWYSRDRLPPIIRDLFGNPFRPVPADPSWLTPTVVALAESIYEDRAFDRLPILADALEDAGCDDADILAHCRGDGPHVRGCWVIDLVLGRS